MPDSCYGDTGADGLFELAVADLWARGNEELVHAAETLAARLRQTQVPLNEQRSEIVLAVAHLRTGNGEMALKHALQGLSLSDQNAASQTKLDHAIALAAAAKAQNMAGNSGEALRLIMLALAKADELQADQRALFDKLFSEG